MTVLRTMFPQAQFAIGSDPNRLVVWARPTDHAEISKAVTEMNKPEPVETARRIVTYDLDTVSAVAALPILRVMFPDAQFSAGTDATKVVAYARPNDQEAIKAAIAEMARKDAPERAYTLAMYTIEPKRGTSGAGKTGRAASSGGAAAAITVLKTMFPQVQLAVGTDPNRVIVWARPADQAEIRKAIDEMNKPEPPETAPHVVTYTLESSNATNAITILRTMFPDAQFSAGTDPSKVIAFARPADHEQIAVAVRQMSEKEPPETARTAVAYTLPSGAKNSGWTVTTALKGMFPSAIFGVGATPNSIVVFARPTEHPEIKTAIDAMSQKEPMDTAVYALEGVTALNAMKMLQGAFPDAQFTVGSDPNKLVVLARPSDQAIIKSAVEQMMKREPAETAPRIAVYTVHMGGSGGGVGRRSVAALRGAAGAIPALKTMFPDAQFSVGSDPSRLVVWARPYDQAQIEKAVAEMGKPEPPETAPRAAVYDVRSIAQPTAIQILQTAFPDAQFAAGSDPNKIVAWARPDDQEQIKRAIAQFEAEGLPGSDRTLSVYPMRREDAGSLTQMLDPLLKKNVYLVTDAARNRLLVWADAKHQATMKQIVEQFSKEVAGVQEPVSRVYRFQLADPRAAQTALAALVPAASIALDATNRSLVVTAMPDDHLKIEATVREMDRSDVGEAPRLEVHRIASADGLSLLRILTALYRTRSDVQVSLDEKNNAIVAVAPPSQHEIIRQLVQQADQGGLADADAMLDMYSLKNVDSTAVMSVLNTVFQRQNAKVQLSIEPRTNQLVAIARPEQHALIRATLERMRGDEQELEIFQLESTDVSTAQMAINRLFAENGMIGLANAPQVDVDVVGQQLFVRATAEQMAQVRDLLIRLGESSLAETHGDTRRTRTIPFQGNPLSALEEIQKVWPQVRPNQIKIINATKAAPDQQAPLPSPKPEAETPMPLDMAPQTPSPKAIPLAPVVAPTPDAAPTPPSASPAAVPQPPAAQQPAVPAPQSETTKPVEAAKPDEPAKPAETPKTESQPAGKTTGAPAKNPFVFAAMQVEPPAAPLPSEPLPPGEPPKVEPGMEHPAASVPSGLQPAGEPASAPADAAPTQPHLPAGLQARPARPPVSASALTKQRSASRSAEKKAALRQSVTGAPIEVIINEDSITISSDDLRALDQFESLLRAAQQHGGMAGRNMHVFILQNARASNVASMLSQLYRTTPSGRRGGTAASTILVIPDDRLNALVVYTNRADRQTVENLVRMLDSPEVGLVNASRVRMIPVKNTDAASIEGILRNVFKTHVDNFGVEPVTNSVVVMAPAKVSDEVARVVKTLDEAVGNDPSRKLRLVPLQKTNAPRVQDALNTILKTTTTRRSGTAVSGSSTRSSSAWGVQTAPSSTTGTRSGSTTGH